MTKCGKRSSPQPGLNQSRMERAKKEAKKKAKLKSTAICSTLTSNEFIGEICKILEPIINWYQPDEGPIRPIEEIIKDIIADLQKDRKEVLALRELIRDFHTKAKKITQLGD